jgi:acetolactate synthase-1/2/3 large subunit
MTRAATIVTPRVRVAFEVRQLCGGSAALAEAAVSTGVSACFANPGTSEVRIVGALDEVTGSRSVLCLFEGVATGAADGYGRVAGRPAMTLLHLGPGLSNGLANLHNAGRAGSPIVNVVGEHASWHLPAESPITTDINALAGTVSGWVRTSRSSQELGRDFTEAVAAAYGPPRRIATLLAPMDCQRGPAKVEPGQLPIRPAAPRDVADERIAEVADLVSRREPRPTWCSAARL